VSLTGGEIVGYEKLVFATGSLSLVPPIHGVDKKGAFPVQKDLSYLWHLFYQITHLGRQSIGQLVCIGPILKS